MDLEYALYVQIRELIFVGTGAMYVGHSPNHEKFPIFFIDKTLVRPDKTVFCKVLKV